jgi:hypothetical protein
VGVAGVAEQQAHRHRLGLKALHLLHHPVDLLVSQRDHRLAVWAGPLGHGHHPIVRHQRLGAGDAQVVERRPVLPGDLQHVGEPVGGHQDRPGDLALQYRVGSRGGAVREQPRRRVGQGLGHPALYPDGLVVRCGRHLHRPRPHPFRMHHHISERPPDINPGTRIQGLSHH